MTQVDGPVVSPPVVSKGTQIKSFVLDTNVLLHNSASLFMFDDNEVVIPFVVLEELDKFKKSNDDVGRNARQVIRHLDSLREKGDLVKGVEWNGNKGTIRVEFATADRPAPLREESPDNRIIAVAWNLKESGKKAIVITKDVNVRLKSHSLGIQTEDFEAQKVDADSLYNGFITLKVSSTIIDTLYEEKQLPIESIREHLVRTTDDGKSVGINLWANQFVQLQDDLDDSHTGLGRVLGDTDHIIPVHGPRKPVFGILARNLQQTMAMDLLLDDDVKLITLLGAAGTGKTLLARAVAG